VQAPAWYRNAIIYSASVETFMDGNGDGVGDFVGLCRRLNHLESLGINTIWLAPSQPTPNRDDGYDIADYYGVDRRLGSSGDFVEFLQEASGRGIRVLLDLVVNHTSDRHPWFFEAQRDSNSSRHDWYVWSQKRPAHPERGIVFPGKQGTTWTYAREARAWYFHRFYNFQPDLNTNNPAVREEIHRIIGYWLRLGVAGFRIDAVPFMIEKPGDRAPHFEYLTELRDLLQWRRGDAIFLGEANIVPRDDDEYFAGGEGLHMIFNFWVNQHLFLALATADARPLVKALRATAKIPEASQWAYFLRNHDELDLGRLTAAARKQVFARFAPEPAMQLYGRGIRRRLAPMLGDRKRLELAYSLLLSLPGTPVLRYGEEIGMGEDLRLKERNAIRTPMQWSADVNAGFSTADRLVRRVIADGPYGYRAVNVDAQERDPHSLLRWLTNMIRTRKRCPEIGAGQWRALPTRNVHLIALEYTDTRAGTVMCIHNLDERPHETTLETGGRLDSLLDGETLAARSGRMRIRLDPLGYRWYRLRSDQPRSRGGHS
jgi:maltose alpha-D-glucosyltransferase / alpha-amylase